MDRLISEQAVIESIEFFQMNPQHFDFVNLIDDIKDIPSAEPRWIPVNDRLPEKYTYTLWCSLGGCVQSDYFNGEFWEDAEKYGYEVIAWMPLPQAYKVESEGEK